MSKQDNQSLHSDDAYFDHYTADDLTRTLLEKRNSMFLHLLAGMQEGKADRLHNFMRFEDELIKILLKKEYISGYNDGMAFLNSLSDDHE